MSAAPLSGRAGFEDEKEVDLGVEEEEGVLGGGLFGEEEEEEGVLGGGLFGEEEEEGLLE